MCGIIVYISAAVLGVDYGWQPVAGGGIEYIIQIEPELLDSLKAGHDLFSDLPPAMRNIRSYRITVGNGRLPHHGEPPPASAGPAKDGAYSSPHAPREESEPPGSAGRAKGGAVTGAAAEVAAPTADLSQLPGPILGPALVLHPPANNPEDNEPPRLVENEAKPLANRVAGYHGKSDAPATEAGERTSADDAPPPTRSHVPHKNESPTEPATKPARTGQKPDGPTDGAKKVGEAVTAPALMQLGLCASLCGNVFLLWVAAGQRSSYRALVRRMFENRTENITALPSPSGTPRVQQVAATESGASPSKTEQVAG